MTTEPVRIVRCTCGLPVEEHLTHYIVVRRDLPLGVILAQVTHAAGESFYKLAEVAQRKSSGFLTRGSEVQVLPSAPPFPPLFPAGSVAGVLTDAVGSNPAPGASSGGTGLEALPDTTSAQRESPAVNGERGPGSANYGTFNPSETYAIVLGARNESKLYKLLRHIIRDRIPHVAVFEPDEPYNGALMAIGLVPAPKQKIMMYINDFHMLKELGV